MTTTTSTRSRRFALPAALLLATGLLGAACSAKTNTADNQTGTSVEGGMQVINQDAGPAVSGGSLRFCIAGETLTGWDPTNSQWVSTSYNVANSVFDPLVAVGSDGEYVPYLLESIEPQDGSEFKVWKLKIRPGITFHNGTKLDASAVAKNLKIRSERGLVATAFEPIDTVEPSGDLEVTVTMKTPWSTFPYALTAQAGYMQAPEQVPTPGTEEKSPPEAATAPIGTGPFKFVEWIQDKEFTARKNESYWQKDADGNALPYLDEISFPVLVDFQSRGQSLESGSCDAMETIDPASILKFQDLAAQGKYQMYTDDALEPGKIFITLNTATEPFNDPLAREILAYGIDTQLVSDDGFLGVFPPATGPLSVKNANYLSPDETGYPKYDLAKAEELHNEYKAKHGKPLSFSAIIPPITEYQQVAELIRQMGEPFGLQVEIKTEDQPTIVNDLVTGNYTSSGTASQGRILFVSPIPDADYIFVASDPKPVGQISLNFARQPNETLKACLDEMRTTDDPAAWKTAADCEQKELAKSLQYIWLVEIRSAVVMQNNVHGFTDQTAPGGQDLPDSPNPFYAQVWKA